MLRAARGRERRRRHRSRAASYGDPSVEIVLVQDVGLSGADDPAVLEWAALQNRVMVTHDVSPLAKHAFDRVSPLDQGRGRWPSLSGAPLGRTIDDLL